MTPRTFLESKNQQSLSNEDKRIQAGAENPIDDKESTSVPLVGRAPQKFKQASPAIIAFFMGAHQRLGKESSIRALTQNPLYDSNALRDVWELLEEKRTIRIKYIIGSNDRSGTDSGWEYGVRLLMVSTCFSRILGSTDITRLRETVWMSLKPDKKNAVFESTVELPLVGVTPEIIWSKIIADCKEKLSGDAQSVIKLDNITIPAGNSLAEYIEFEKMKAAQNAKKIDQPLVKADKPPAKKL